MKSNFATLPSRSCKELAAGRQLDEKNVALFLNYSLSLLNQNEGTTQNH